MNKLKKLSSAFKILGLFLLMSTNAMADRERPDRPVRWRCNAFDLDGWWYASFDENKAKACEKALASCRKRSPVPRSCHLRR